MLTYNTIQFCRVQLININSCLVGTSGIPQPQNINVNYIPLFAGLAYNGLARPGPQGNPVLGTLTHWPPGQVVVILMEF